MAIYGYSAYAASKWALRGLAESLQMELKPYNIYVSVAYPPDTDTPGYEVEMQSKPEITKKLSESGTLFSSTSVARDIVEGSTSGHYSITSGLDGWFLKQLHPGMAPLNNIWEVLEGIVFGSLARVVSVFYLLEWDNMCSTYHVEKMRRADKAGSSNSGMETSPFTSSATSTGAAAVETSYGLMQQSQVEEIKY